MNKCSQLEAQVQQLENENRVLLGEMSKMRKEILELRKRVKSQDPVKESAIKRQLESMTFDIDDHQKTIKKLKAENDKLRSEKAGFSAELDTMYLNIISTCTSTFTYLSDMKPSTK